jgi:hypothetical protein
MSEAARELPTRRAEAVAFPAVQLNVTEEELNLEPGIGLMIWAGPAVGDGVGVGAIVGVGVGVGAGVGVATAEGVAVGVGVGVAVATGTK